MNKPCVFAVQPLHAGATLGRYEILSTLGRGGMACVYLAWDATLQRPVALKVPFSPDIEVAARLELEARIAASLSHPRICAVYDLERAHERPFIVMEYLEGETLAQRLLRAPLPIADVLMIAGEIADALERAHGEGIAHRDLKPANVMLTASGVKLLDFGVAEYTGGFEVDDDIGGTVQYMAPEVIAGSGADVRGDVFSFGVVLREMITGSGTQGEIARALDRITRRCLRADPEERWPSLHDVRVKLTALLARRTGRAVRPSR